MKWRAKPALTRQAWLEKLARRLAWSFPEPQAKEILTDLQTQFEAGREHGKSDAEIIDALGTPREAVAQLLEEEPAARIEQFRHTLLWAAAAVVCWAFVWLNFLGSMNTRFLLGVCVFLPVSTAVLFMLVRGPARVSLERIAAPEKRISPAAVYCIPAGTVIVVTVLQEILILSIFRLNVRVLPVDIGPMNVFALELIALAMALLAAWQLFRSVTRSIRYFPGIVHAGGAAFSILAITSVYTSMDVEIDPIHTHALELGILFRLAPYLAGLVTARVFQRWVDGSKPLPHCFRPKNVTWPDWRHNLAVRLLGWFPAGQTIEILEDYQEQFELGREQGKAESDLLAEMGRPSTIVRDLLAEDRKARLRRRKQWPWVVMCVLAGWLLLVLMRAFEFGYTGFGWFYSEHIVQIGVLAVVLGTVSLFVLLRVRDRAVVEQRFPTQKMPTVWLYLLPVALAMVLNGFIIYLCTALWSFPRTVRLYLVIGIESSVLILCILMIWTLARCFSGSIRYLPAAIHAAGCICYILCTGVLCHGIDFEGMVGNLLYIWFLPCLLPYAVSITLALAVWLILRAAGKPRKEG